MAIDNRLQVFNEEGQSVDYDILASDVKFLPDGKDLPTKLAEMEAHQGDGTVKGVKMNNGSPIEPDGDGVVDLGTVITQHQDISGKVDKETGKSLMSAEEHTKLAGIEAGAEKNIIKGIKANGASTNLPVDQNGVVELPPAGSTISPATASPSMDGTASVGSSDKYAREDHVHPHDTSKLSKSDVSVETQGDGTVDINVADDTYTINLNHTHEDMVKLEKFVESNPPASMTDDKIYVQVDDLTTPTEIEALYIFGLEFAGGGGGTPGLPAMQSPSDGSTINLGENQGSGVSQNITVRAKNLNYGGSTDGLTIDAIGTGLTLSYGQQTGQSSITIPQTNGVVSTEVSVVFSGVGEFNGELRFKQGSTVLAVVVVVVLPDGFIANKAWNQNGNNISLVDASGYCVSKQYEVDDNHTFEVCFGFANSGGTQYGCAVSNKGDMLSSGSAGTCFWANNVVRTFKPNDDEKYLSCTFLKSELANCYIKDTTSNTYIWKGNNVT